MFPMIQMTFGDTTYSRHMPDTSHVFNFSDLQDAISAIDAVQVDGKRGCETACGVPYVIIRENRFFRPGDERAAEKVVCENAIKEIIDLIDKVQMSRTPIGGEFRIEWRIRPEFVVREIRPEFVVREEGIFIECDTDKGRAKDRNWKLAQVYARLAVIPVLD